MFDVIVIGGRVAGSATAMLLASKGFRVLVLERGHFPSDTISTHQIQLKGVACLRRWRLLEKLEAIPTPAAKRVRFDAGFGALDGEFPEFEAVNAVYGPRRTYLDKVLVDAARQAGAELREEFVVDRVLMDGGRVCGVAGHDWSGNIIEEKATLVIGADGKHSMLAAAVQAPQYDLLPAATCAYYSYFSGVPLVGGMIYSQPRRAIGAR